MLYPRSQDPKWQSRNFFTVKVFNHINHMQKKKKMKTLYKEPPFTHCSDATFLKIFASCFIYIFPQEYLKASIRHIISSLYPFLKESNHLFEKGRAFFLTKHNKDQYYYHYLIYIKISQIFLKYRGMWGVCMIKTKSSVTLHLVFLSPKSTEGM